jgi:hypothetical protein
MRRYVDTFFRYWLIALLPILVLPLAEFAMSGRSGTTVSASANLFVQQAVDTTASYSSQPLTPAQSEQSYLGQWLQSPSFGLRVTQGSPLFARHLQPTNDLGAAASVDLLRNVQLNASGDNLLTLSYGSPDGSLDVQVLGALIAAMRENENALRQQQASLGVQYYAAQLRTAQQHEQQSAAQLTGYMLAHHVTAAQLSTLIASDITLDNLYQQNRVDQSAVTAMQQQVANYSSQASLPSTVANLDSFSVIDQPGLTISVAGKSKQILRLAVALLIGLLFGGGFVVIMTALDRTLRFADEVPLLLDLPVLAVVPHNAQLARRRLIGQLTGAGTERPRSMASWRIG